MPPKRSPNNDPVSVACTVWQVLTVSSSGLTQLFGAFTSLASALPPRRPLSANAPALCVEIRDSPISATEQKINTMSKSKITTSIAAFADGE